ncbi:MAG: TRAP transporter substrate-binding protein DctP [Dehalococcoidia bacterium]|nr:TRAP transporter substrate-binding protein DctP [Dehalococcoidia bacterium]
MTKKTVSGMLFSLCLVLALSVTATIGCAPAQDQGGSAGGDSDAAGYGTWRYADIHPVDAPAAVMAMGMADLLRDRTDGRIDIEYYPSCQLGDWSEVLENVEVGTVDMGITTANDAYDARFGIDWAPYRFFTWEQAADAFEPGGWCLEILEGIYESHNVKFLGYGLRGFTGVSLNEYPGKLPPAPTGIKIRTPPIASWKAAWETMGYVPTAIPFSEVYTSIQTGVVEGQAGGGSEQMYIVVGDIQGCWIQTNDWMDNQPIGMNLDLWNSLTAEDQGILMDTVNETLWGPDGFNKESEELEAVWRQKAKDDYGIESYILTEAELAECAKVVREKVWPSLEADFGTDIYNAMLANCAPL